MVAGAAADDGFTADPGLLRSFHWDCMQLPYYVCFRLTKQRTQRHKSTQIHVSPVAAGSSGGGDLQL